jgi:hypothetical protein
MIVACANPAMLSELIREVTPHERAISSPSSVAAA